MVLAHWLMLFYIFRIIPSDQMYEHHTIPHHTTLRYTAHTKPHMKDSIGMYYGIVLRAVMNLSL